MSDAPELKRPPQPVPPWVRHPVRRWVVLGSGFVAAAVALAVGVGQLPSRQGWTVEAGPTTVAPSVFGVPEPTAPDGDPSPMPDPDAACLAAALNAVPQSGDGNMNGYVIGLASGAVLWDRGGSQPVMPASTLKVLTTLALVDALGPGALAATYKTSVVAGGGDQIVLVGGGDPYLASRVSLANLGQPATLNDLAAATAEALKAAGRTQVRVGYDGGIFTGPDWHPTWDGTNTTDVTRISALWADEGMTPPAGATPSVYNRSSAPAQDAAFIFANQLQAHGIGVTTVAPATAPAGAQPIASIESLPLRDIIASVLLMSDNSAAEVLLRHLAIAKGRPGTFVDGAQSVTDWLAAHNLATPGTHIADGSGLSRSNLVPTATLAAVIEAAAASDGPAREVIARLPVAAASGTLLDRFQEPYAGMARGRVHAKTGSLTGVASLAGYTVTTSGQWLAFAVVISGSTQGYVTARSWLDRQVATMTTAQC